ncbi:MAG: COX15/CtaA family protein [Pirellulaceae bacterium]|nr:COX15/CtaA family protein [Planctomycetales bacterium]
MTNVDIPADTEQRGAWPHRLAVLLVCATFPLIWVGGLVTTYDAGMAVPDWPSTYGYNLFLYPWQTWVSGPWDLFIEHGHRLLGATVGMLAIAAMVTIVWKDSRRWVKVLSVIALTAVCLQGVLGGQRVLWNNRQIAQLHGVFGPVCFCLFVSLAVVTSQWWRATGRTGDSLQIGNMSARGAVGATVLSGCALVQLILGSQLRHVMGGAGGAGFRVALLFHLVLAAVIFAQTVWLVAIHLAATSRDGVKSVALSLMFLVLLQVGLGLATWVLKYYWPAWAEGAWFARPFTIVNESMPQSLVVTGHVATGSLILAMSVKLALRSWRLCRPANINARPPLNVKGTTLTMGVAL